MRALLPLLMAAMLAAGDALVLASGYDPAVRAFTLDGDGNLHPLSTSTLGKNPSFLAIAPDARMAYACSEVGAGRIIACTFDRGTGALTVLGSASSGGNGPCHVALHPSGRWLLCANYGDGRVAVLPRAADGGIGEPVCVLEAGAHAHMALPTRDGLRVLIPCKGTDQVVVAAFDPASGRLTVTGSVATAAGAGPRHLAWSADGGSGVLINELGNSVQTITVTAGGLPVLGAPLSTLPAAWQGKSTAASVVLDGTWLYASNRGHDSVATFRLGDGQPALVGHSPVGRTPRHLAVSPDGRFVLAACQDGGRIDVLRRQGDGGLALVGSTQVPKPAWVGFATGP